MRSFVYGEPPFPVCADSLYILKHILPEQLFVIVFAICVVGAFIAHGSPLQYNNCFAAFIKFNLL